MKKNVIAYFPQQTMQYLNKLQKNNSREWFTANKEAYEVEFLIPAQQYVIEMGEMLSPLFPELHAIPKVDKSIFRLMRDVRFSKNKEPYKTNLGIFIWDGKAPRMEAPGFYTHIEPKSGFVASGTYMFTKDYLTKYREVVSGPAGQELKDAIKKVQRKGSYLLGGKKYKRVPKGYDPENPNADLLLHESLYMYTENFTTADFKQDDFITFSFKHFKAMMPVHQWLMKYLFP